MIPDTIQRYEDEVISREQDIADGYPLTVADLEREMAREMLVGRQLFAAGKPVTLCCTLGQGNGWRAAQYAAERAARADARLAARNAADAARLMADKRLVYEDDGDVLFAAG